MSHHMLDYYKILGIPQAADYSIVKAAYKKLALKYHPDRNPGNKAAEEFFKVINEAHQLLSKPEKKSQYDLLLQYYYQQYQQKEPAQKEYYKHAANKSNYRSVYDRYGKTSWRNIPNYKTAPTYRVDRNYFKIQFVTLASVTFIAFFIIGISKYNQHLKDVEATELKKKNEKVLSDAKSLYNKGQYRLALTTIENLIHQNPIEPQFYREKESMVASLTALTTQLYRKAEYSTAIRNLEVLRDYQSPMRLATWKMIADCNLQLKEYGKAIHALEYILIRDKSNIDLVVKVGDIYFDNLQKSEKALEYYTRAKYLFKEFQSASYGEAFELIMPAEKTPEIYYELFMKRAEANKALGDYEEAVTDYNWAIFLRPERSEAYLLRGDCRIRQGNNGKACRDWARASELGNADAHIRRNKSCL
ncbi:DnaJ domain-containing protein [Fulvivirga ulvae]|uniref:tetratricopeptide repeat protein n=1 Tax=Fulvivirga ulvae TaxID=2904245 RepID=UPI001F3A482B|nr:DnaJ domain-containing protein [Fulvivirga ulvae]UII32000.1 DnaJ domain-containing protein [Fulvivirga ulvae]